MSHTADFSREFILYAGIESSDSELVTILWLAQNDPDVANAESALDLWVDCRCELPENYLESILKYLCSEYADIRLAAAEALGFGLQVSSIIFGKVKYPL